MQLCDFDYELPPELIAQHPPQQRSSSRLLVCEEGTLQDQQFYNLPDFLQSGDLLVFNNTRVIPARLYGQKETGGKVEVLIERMLADQQALAHIKASKAPKPGQSLYLEGDLHITVLGRQDSLFILQFHGNQSVFQQLEQCGHIPLPPYINREDTLEDRERYQTVYATAPGAVAAPTAGLHFDQKLIDLLQTGGIQTTSVTLHVGSGTFQPVRQQDLSRHIMHAEYVNVPQTACDAIMACRQRGGRVVAVGTTAVRSLESAARHFMDKELQAFQGDTQLFIQPGFDFRVVDALLTNFHLPESTLLMLVAAFMGYDNMRVAYEHAIKQRYRFFSYGDAMLLLTKR